MELVSKCPSSLQNKTNPVIIFLKDKQCTKWLIQLLFKKKSAIKCGFVVSTYKKNTKS